MTKIVVLAAAAILAMAAQAHALPTSGAAMQAVPASVDSNLVLASHVRCTKPRCARTDRNGRCVAMTVRRCVPVPH